MTLHCQVGRVVGGEDTKPQRVQKRVLPQDRSGSPHPGQGPPVGGIAEVFGLGEEPACGIGTRRSALTLWAGSPVVACTCRCWSMGEGFQYGCCVTEKTACSCVSGGTGTLDGCSITLARSGARAVSKCLGLVWLRGAIQRERRLTSVGMRPSGRSRITTRNMPPASMRSHPCVPTCIVRY